MASIFHLRKELFGVRCILFHRYLLTCQYISKAFEPLSNFCQGFSQTQFRQPAPAYVAGPSIFVTKKSSRSFKVNDSLRKPLRVMLFRTRCGEQARTFLSHIFVLANTVVLSPASEEKKVVSCEPESTSGKPRFFIRPGLVDMEALNKPAFPATTHFWFALPFVQQQAIGARLRIDSEKMDQRFRRDRISDKRREMQGP